jgi:hypothetical protein
MNKKMAGEFVMTLFHARTAAHVLHLNATSYAQHVALSGFYDDIVGLVDAFAEAYQGRYGLIETYPAGYKHPTDAVAFFTQLRKWVEERRAECEVTELQNMIDEILSLLDSTIYKLKFLK